MRSGEKVCGSKELMSRPRLEMRACQGEGTRVRIWMGLRGAVRLTRIVRRGWRAPPASNGESPS